MNPKIKLLHAWRAAAIFNPHGSGGRTTTLIYKLRTKNTSIMHSFSNICHHVTASFCTPFEIFQKIPKNSKKPPSSYQKRPFSAVYRDHLLE